MVGPDPADGARGHVYHYYLIASARGRGLAAQLDDHALRSLAQDGYRTAQLNLTPGNADALAFYARRGWTVAAAEMPGVVITLEKEIEVASD